MNALRLESMNEQLNAQMNELMNALVIECLDWCLQAPQEDKEHMHPVIARTLSRPDITSCVSYIQMAPAAAAG
jgi:hypothetical protein